MLYVNYTSVEKRRMKGREGGRKGKEGKGKKEKEIMNPGWTWIAGLVLFLFYPAWHSFSFESLQFHLKGLWMLESCICEKPNMDLQSNSVIKNTILAVIWIWVWILALPLQLLMLPWAPYLTFLRLTFLIRKVGIQIPALQICGDYINWHIVNNQ